MLAGQAAGAKPTESRSSKLTQGGGTCMSQQFIVVALGYSSQEQANEETILRYFSSVQIGLARYYKVSSSGDSMM